MLHHVKHFIFAFVFFITGLCCLSSCRHQSPQVNSDFVPKAALHLISSHPPRVVTAKKPKSTYLNTCPKPKNINISVHPPIIKKLVAGQAQGKRNFISYTTDNGLALDANACACMDHFGNLWFGSYGDGVSCFNGKLFTNYTTAQGLASNRVFSIIEDKKGNMWFATSGGGASCYNGKSFTNYTMAQGLVNNSVNAILQDKKENLWFGTAGGISRYDGKSFTNFTTAQGLVNNFVYSIFQDKKGNLWFGTYGGGVSCFNGKTFTNYTTAQGLANNFVYSILQDKKGNLWFGTQGGVSCYNGKTFTNFTTAQGLANNIVYDILQDKKGNLWFTTRGGGVSCYNGKTFTNYTMAQGLGNDIVYSILQDKEGNLWFTTRGGGVSCYKGKSFISYNTAHGLPNNLVWSILQDKKGNLWFGTSSGGVSCYDGKSFTTYTTVQGLTNNIVYSILQDKKENLWFGTNVGISRYDGKSFTNYTTAQGLGNNAVRSMFQDKKGNIWFGTQGGGVSRYDGKSFTTYTTAQGLANNFVYSIAQDKKGNMWFATNGGGVSRYDGKSFTTYTTAQGLGNNTVLSILQDKKGNLWFGTSGGGISRYDGKSFLTFTTAQGLSENDISGAVIDKRGEIVIGTNFGISVLSAFTQKSNKNKHVIPAQNNLTNKELQTYTPVFKIYNSKTGYPVKDVNTGNDNGAMLCDSKGIIWTGTGSQKTALVRIDLSAVNKDTLPPTVVINSIKIDQENVCWYILQQSPSVDQSSKSRNALPQQEAMTYGKVLNPQERDAVRKQFAGIKFDDIAKFYPLPKKLVLPYNHNNITFSFTAVETARNFMVRYQYILEGYDKNWSPVTDKTQATFGNIYEGTYTFKVKARSPEGIWGEPITYTFKVLPPWYRTWWAYILYVIIIFLILFRIYNWRIATMRKEKEILEKTVKRRTLEVVKQKSLLEEKNKSITDSITYAKRIQEAILPSRFSLSENLKNGFVFFKPKDIVSGDFYWLETAPAAPKRGEQNRVGNNTQLSPSGGGGAVYFAVADCTGHGVPGAMVSVVCANALSKALLEENITETGKILDRTRELVIERFSHSDENVKDGMDISLCKLTLPSSGEDGGGLLQWSGANNPLWIIRSNVIASPINREKQSQPSKEASTSKHELIEKKPDKQPIGVTDNPKPFTTHNIELQKGDSIYIFSDGFADQFGGESGKKFKYKPLKELLLSIQDKKMDKQKEAINQAFERWKGDEEQVDDICVIGVVV